MIEYTEEEKIQREKEAAKRTRDINLLISDVLGDESEEEQFATSVVLKTGEFEE